MNKKNGQLSVDVCIYVNIINTLITVIKASIVMKVIYVRGKVRSGKVVLLCIPG